MLVDATDNAAIESAIVGADRLWLEGLLRVSVGLEHAGDLFADLAQALNHATGTH